MLYRKGNVRVGQLAEARLKMSWRLEEIMQDVFLERTRQKLHK